MKKEVREAMKQYVYLNTKMQNAYFWRPPQNANGRRDYEHKNSMERCEYTIEGHTLVMCYNVKCSCAHIYITKLVLWDGKIKDVRMLKKLLGNRVSI